MDHSTALPAPERPPRLLTAAWLLIAFLWIAYFLNYCDRQVIYAIFPLLKRELGFSNAQLGLTGSLFIWATGLASPFAGPLSARYSRRRLVVWNLLLWSAVTFLTGLATSPAMLLSARGVLGLTEALFIPLAISLIGSFVPPALQSRAVALFFTAQLCGVVIGGSVGGWIAERFGWRVSFLLLGILGTCFAAPLSMFFRRFREPVPSPHSPTHAASSFRELACVPTFVSLCACFPAFMLVLTIFYAWLPSILHDRFSLSLAEAAFDATVYLQVGTALGLLGGSFLSDWLYRRNRQARFWLLTAAILFGAPCVYAVGHAQSTAIAGFSAAAFGLANGVYTANLMVAPFDVLPAHGRTSAIAVINTIAPPFTGLGALLTGVWKDRIGIPNLMSILALVTAFSGLALLVCTALFFDRDYHRLLVASSPQPHTAL